jgi:tetratricopeptide (TPR) repeat protein
MGTVKQLFFASLFITTSLFGYVSIETKTLKNSITSLDAWQDFFGENRVIIYYHDNRYELRIDNNNYRYIKNQDNRAKEIKKRFTFTTSTIELYQARSTSELKEKISLFELFYHNPLYIEKHEGVYYLKVDKVTPYNIDMLQSNENLMSIESFEVDEQELESGFIEEYPLHINPFYPPYQSLTKTPVKKVEPKKIKKKVVKKVAKKKPTTNQPLTPYQKGLKLYQAQQYEASLAIFDELFLSDMTNNEYSFMMGLNYFGLRDYDNAMAAYDRILISDPNNLRVRLEIAKTLFFMKKYDTSEKEFRAILEEILPKNVRKNVEKFLAYIEAKKRNHFFNAILIAGFNYDSNINQINENSFPEQLQFEGLTLTTDDNTIVGAFAHQEIAMLNYKYRLTDDLYLKNDTMLFNKMLIDVTGKDIILGSNTSTLELSHQNQTFALSGYYDRLIYASEDTLQTWAILTTHGIKLSPTMSLNSFFKFQDRLYIEEASQSRDSYFYELSSTLNYMLKTTDALSFNILYDLERAKQSDEDVDYSAFTLNSSYTHMFDKTFNSGAKLTYKGTWYTNSSTKDDEGNNRSTNAITTTLNSTYIRWGFMFQGSVAYQKTFSNITTFQFDKWTSGITIIKPF